MEKKIKKPFYRDLQNYETYYGSMDGLLNYSSKRADCWYLEKTKEGKFAVEYFSSLEERKFFFKKYKNFEIGQGDMRKFFTRLKANQEYNLSSKH